jgi:hypothetical protein
MPQSVYVVPVETLGNELAVLPVRLQLLITLSTSDGHWSIAQNLLHQTKGNSVSSFYQNGGLFSSDVCSIQVEIR